MPLDYGPTSVTFEMVDMYLWYEPFPVPRVEEVEHIPVP